MAACGDLKERRDLRIYSNLDDLTTELAEYIACISEISVRERGSFAIALSGGSLVDLIGKLSGTPFLWTVDWSKWHIFFTDERAVAKNHMDSNYKQVKDAFLSKVPVPPSHVCSINDNVCVETAAHEYEFAIRQLVRVRTIDVSVSKDCPKFDLILLEMGPDGHVAALFPSHPALRIEDNWVTYIIDSPKTPPERITFTLPVINSASNVAIVAAGEDKADAVLLAIAESGKDKHKFNACSPPAQMVDPADGKLVWFLDKSAASKLDSDDAGSSQQF
ncbi:probable 6-phosphogluconolactonase 2 [Typha angustifolia]|uniref:probable 6-phosphogluconolactonase 2 n=1 Tax=Typha angustifolia TaxID=59011 RepID=UPI003C3056D5